MTDDLDAIRKRHDLFTRQMRIPGSAESPVTTLAAVMSAEDVRALLALVDKQAKQIEALQEYFVTLMVNGQLSTEQEVSAVELLKEMHPDLVDEAVDE